MSMSTFLVGFVEPDERWQKMKAVYVACTAAGIDLPEEAEDYFETVSPEDIMRDTGAEIGLEDIAEEYNTKTGQGYELEIRKIPKDVTRIRFYNSW